MKKLLILCAGGMGRETAMLVEEINRGGLTWEILGFLDDDKALHQTMVNGYRVLGGIDDLKAYESCFVICALADTDKKRKIIERVKTCEVSFANIIHPSVLTHWTNNFGEDIIIYPGVTMTTNITVGDHVIISAQCGIGHESVIKDYVTLLWNVNVSGKAVFEEGCLVGSGATILQQITIGAGTTVGAGAVVTKDAEPHALYVGVPARKVKDE